MPGAPTNQQIADALYKLGAAVAEILGYKNTFDEILRKVDHTAQEPTTYAIYNYLKLLYSSSWDAINHRFFAAHTDTIVSNLESNLRAYIDTKLEHMVVDNVAPGWYTAPEPTDLSGIPQAVLDATIDVEDWCQLDPSYPVSWILSNLYQFVQLQTRGNGYAWIGDPHFTLHDCYPWTLIANLHGDDGREVYLPPTVDWATYDGSVDLASFLNSIDVRNTWHGYGVLGSTANGCQRELTNQPLDQSYVECHLQWTRTNQLVNTLTTDVGLLPDQIVGPPVWPGLANVTLGTPVALDSGVTIVTPMDGVVISITGTDPGYGYYYTFDDLRQWRTVGALTFLDDDGHAEGYQALGFVSAVYCPRSIQRAAAVKVKAGHGLAGTITPWTITGR